MILEASALWASSGISGQPCSIYACPMPPILKLLSAEPTDFLISEPHVTLRAVSGPQGVQSSLLN